MEQIYNALFDKLIQFSKKDFFIFIFSGFTGLLGHGLKLFKLIQSKNENFTLYCAKIQITHHMLSKTQVELGAAYWWQPRQGSSPERVEVIAFMPRSITRVKCKNVSPDRPFVVSVRDAHGVVHKSTSDKPKGSTYGKNLQRGDVYEDVNISQLTSTEPVVIHSGKSRGGIKPVFKA